MVWDFKIFKVKFKVDIEMAFRGHCRGELRENFNQGV